MTSDTPVITVVGSTSKQGHSVAKSLLATGDYTVRALTRNPNGECAHSLPPNRHYLPEAIRKFTVIANVARHLASGRCSTAHHDDQRSIRRKDLG